ncbi:MAG: phenylalanyl-tRNA synthetase beta chain [Actinomycetota bacterium]
MKILLSWLNEFGPFAAADSDDEVAALAADLTSLGLAVESVDRTGDVVEGVVAARVLRVETHPDAAKVRRVWVDAGDGVERHVWCGASNMAPGDVVPLATLGTEMPDGRRIERRGILGIDSEGMLCSPAEIGVAGDPGGILIMPPDSPLGVSYASGLGVIPDVVLDLDLTRNRPDCWSVLGVARDLAALRGTVMPEAGGPVDRAGQPCGLGVDILAGDACGRFTATLVSGVVVTAAPRWMAERLESVGMRSINNVVDASNYVMLELGQPNHAYDSSRLAGGLRVRYASAGETLTTLDGVERTCRADDLLICDGDDVPVGLAGVMGGADSEIDDSTTEVVLEVAWFAPAGVMATAQRHGLRSEASARYERGVDPWVADRAIERFAELLSETCPDLVIHPPTVEARGDCLPPAERSVSVRVAQVNRILGTRLSPDDLPALLDPIGFTVTAVGEASTVGLPTWRPDSTAEIDVVEEIARLYGYDRLSRSTPRVGAYGHLSSAQRRRRLVREVLVGLGISEAMPNPFVAPDTMARAGIPGEVIRILNPLVTEESALRTALRPGLLGVIAHNEHHRRDGVRLFEVGHVFRPGPGELPDEFESLCVVLAGCDAPAAVRVWGEVSSALGVGAMLDQTSPGEGMHPTRSATLRSGREVIGVLGEVHPAVLVEFGVAERVAVLEVRLDALLGREPSPARHRPVSRMPSSDLDLAFVLDDAVPAERLERALRTAAGAMLVDCRLFDVYRGPGVTTGSRSLAWRLRLQSAERNLDDTDIAAVRDACATAAAGIGAQLRG